MKGLHAAQTAAFALLLSQASTAFAQAPPPAAPVAGNASVDATVNKTEAAFQFAIAKELQSEGSLLEANAAMEKATRLDPEAPYLRAEHALILIRLGELSRAPGSRNTYLQQAREEVDRARQLAPNETDILKTAGDVYLSVASQDAAVLDTARDLLEQIRKIDPTDVQSMVGLGRIYLAKNEADKAVEVFRELVANVPQQRAAYAFLVESLLQARREKEAEPVLGEMLTFDPASLEARLTLAELQGQRGDNRAAVETLRAAPQPARAEPRLRRQLAWALYLSGDPEAALTEVQPLLGQPAAADDRALNLLTGLIYTAEGRNAEAADLLAKVRKVQPTDVAVTLTLSRVLQREGRPDEAARALQELADALVQDKKEGAAQQVRLEAAQLLLEAKQWDAAEAVLKPLLAVSDAAVRTQARAYQVDVLVGRQRYDEALGLLGPEDLPPTLVSKRAEVLLRAGREAEGRQLLGTLVSGASASGAPGGAAANARAAEAVISAAQVYQRLERYDEAIQLLRGLSQSQPDLIPAHFLLGAAYERTGRQDEAATQFRRVIELDPEYHAALNYLGYLYAERGEHLDEALALVRRAVALDPDNGSYVDSLGWTYFQLGQREQARDYLERAARLEPKDGTVHEHLGDVYVALGQTEKAREVYRRAVELGDKNAEQVRRKLERLHAPGTPDAPQP